MLFLSGVAPVLDCFQLPYNHRLESTLYKVVIELPKTKELGE